MAPVHTPSLWPADTQRPHAEGWEPILAPLWGAAKNQGPSLVVQIRKITPIPAQDIYPPLSHNRLDKLHIRESMGEGKKAPQNFKSMPLHQPQEAGEYLSRCPSLSLLHQHEDKAVPSIAGRA